MDAPEDVKVELHLTLAEANLVLAALAELPFKVSFPLIQKIKQQGDQQATRAREKLGDPSTPPSDSAKLL